jgi:DnaK suppressor protein
MKKNQIADELSRTGHYRRLLLEKREKLMAGLGIKFDTLAKMGRVAEEDQAQITHDEFVSLHLNRMDFAQLRLVDEALDRLDSGDYGICLHCDEPIPAKRLEALAWARYCVPCQEKVGQLKERESEETYSRVPVFQL